MVHLNPEDLAMVRDYLGDQLTPRWPPAGGRRQHAFLRGARNEAAGSRDRRHLQTRWRRIMGQPRSQRGLGWDGS